MAERSWSAYWLTPNGLHSNRITSWCIASGKGLCFFKRLGQSGILIDEYKSVKRPNDLIVSAHDFDILNSRTIRPNIDFNDVRCSQHFASVSNRTTARVLVQVLHCASVLGFYFFARLTGYIRTEGNPIRSLGGAHG